GIDLWFDADTIYSVADVYAVIYLSYEYGPWNEYAVTEDFTLFGTSGSDDYVIETELISGYETGSYDILIELFDAYDGSFVADIGPDFSSELSLLPLEDAGRDAVGEPRIVVNSGGGGSPGWPLLLALTVVCLINKRHRMSTEV
ncbi:MAG: choice-of-anchor H family protein, partial [Proteobacteria bacterium]|nr:choice-of-anchor H family protein [Pseudomonadota bacterium]